MVDHLNPKLIAFYLPQYHPIPENDAWWGKGFTEWTNVAKAKPLFKGHYQPRIPADLGFYDLRVPETRQAQADLAREYGIYGFCYYHYWFNGKRLLERPFQEVLDSGKPDFPFMLCWANESWTRSWDGRSSELLIKQEYSEEDDIRHIKFLLKAFKDHRYIHKDDKPVFLIYRASQLPDPLRTTNIWREVAINSGLKDIHLLRVESFSNEQDNPQALGFDGAVEFQPDWRLLKRPLGREFVDRLLIKLKIKSNAFLNNRIYKYEQLIESDLEKNSPNYTRYPCVTPGWDNSPRRDTDAVILKDSTPELYQHWLKNKTIQTEKWHKKDNFVFINAWNEWGEGNHLEPDLRNGHAYLQATKNAQQL